MFETQTTPLTALTDPLFSAAGVQVWLKRDDLIHPLLSGNKWHKLKLNLAEAREQGVERLLSFGGAYSNHLHALAYAGHQYGFNTLGLVRGEPHSPLNATLQDATDFGMELVYLDRAQYRQRHNPAFQTELLARYPGSLLVPEGGANSLGVKGCEAISEQILQQQPEVTHLLVACGTGTTLAGMINGCSQPGVQLLGVSVLKGQGVNAAIEQAVHNFLLPAADAEWVLLKDYSCSGYGRINAELVTFMDRFEARHGIELDPVYTGKLLFALYDLIAKGHFPPGSRIAVVHTGGLQGKRGMLERMAKLRQS